jgi:hypothetical protein
VKIFHSIADAVKDGWTQYDRWPGGVVFTQRINGKTEVAVFDCRREPLPAPDLEQIRTEPSS